MIRVKDWAAFWRMISWAAVAVVCAWLIVGTSLKLSLDEEGYKKLPDWLKTPNFTRAAGAVTTCSGSQCVVDCSEIKFKSLPQQCIDRIVERELEIRGATPRLDQYCASKPSTGEKLKFWQARCDVPWRQ